MRFAWLSFFALTTLAGCACLRPDVAQESRSSRRTCLVLSVGGFKGLAHVGAIEALQERDVPIDCVAGNSMGALIGALYATAPDEDPGPRVAGFLQKYEEQSREDAK
ncbi:MAG: patatin-like phospholipase family protein, partial [Stellaceae bacterium]